MTLLRRARLSVLLAVFLGSIAAAEPARADDSTLDEARGRMEKGQKLFADAKYADATSEFEAAYKAQPYKAFLYNAAVAAERSGDKERAVAHYEEFIRSEPNAPDAADIRATIDRLKKQDQTAPQATTPVQQIRSLVVVLSDPKGAPVSIYRRLIPSAVFDPKKAEQAGWKLVAANLTTPADLSFPVGTYHITVEGFRDFKRSDTELDLQAGTVYVYKAGLSQGEIIGKVQVKSPVAGARIYLDDPTHKNAPVALTPATVDAAPGAHTINISSSGFEEWSQKIDVKQGEVIGVQADLARLKYGYLLVDANVEEMKVKVDGVSEGTHAHHDGPLKLRLDAGAHDVVVDAGGMNAYRAKLAIPGGQELPVRAKLTESAGKGGGIAFAILGAGLVGGATAFYVLGSREKDKTTEKNFKYVSIAGFAGAGAFAGLSILFLAYDPTEKSTAKLGAPREFDPSVPAANAETPKKTSSVRWTLAPVVGDSLGGLDLIGTF